jgi:8-oxo-dGTP diphosphatase
MIAEDPARMRRPLGSGDAWVEAPDGKKYWGSFGAAGLLVVDPRHGILLQHRATWSHFGGTWGLPGGARHQGETAVEAALREAHEEAGVPEAHLRLLFSSVLDLGYWSYTTVVVKAVDEFTAEIGDAESLELRWIAPGDVADVPLHPGFAASWPQLHSELDRPVLLVVDSANVVGTRPQEQWWKDRAAATERLAARLQGLAARGVPGKELSLGFDTWWPEIVLVTEGQAASADLAEPASALAAPVRIVRAEGSGDDSIVEEVASALAAGADADADEDAAIRPRVYVVTADRELAARVGATGAAVLSPSLLWRLLDAPA